MSSAPEHIFLDTNVYIIGSAYQDSAEAAILHWAGIDQDHPGPVEIIVSDELFEQILRVARRLRSKDWGGELLGRIWQCLRLRYVLLDTQEIAELEATSRIPREDVGVYMTARRGNAGCFVSANHQLIRTLAENTGEFKCLTPKEFVQKYLR